MLAAHPLACMARVVRFMDEHPYERMRRRRAERLARNVRYRWVGVLVAWVALVACIVTVAWFVSINVDIRPERCTVVSAVPDSSSGGSRGSASTPGVLVRTEECGPIHVAWGVTFDSEEEVAGNFEAGAVWEFDLSWGNREVNRKWLKIVPFAKNQRLVESPPVTGSAG